MRIASVLKSMMKIVPYIGERRIIKPEMIEGIKVSRRNGKVMITMQDGRIMKGDGYLDGVSVDKEWVGFLRKGDKICIPSAGHAEVSDLSRVLMMVLYYFLPAVGDIKSVESSVLDPKSSEALMWKDLGCQETVICSNQWLKRSVYVGDVADMKQLVEDTERFMNR